MIKGSSVSHFGRFKIGTSLLWRALILLTLAFLTVGRDDEARAEDDAFVVDDEIVYFDTFNTIRAFDPSPPSTKLTLDWASPDGGWSDMVLADVTGDGDAEIIAIRPESNGGRLTIFDPVAVDSPEDQVFTINGIPWAILYELHVAQAPRTITTGEFDTSRPGQEILYSYTVNEDIDRFVLLRSTGNGLPGREWEEQKVWELEGRWSASATGNMYIDDAIDEVSLVSFERGELGIFRIIPNVVQTFSNVNEEARWRDVAFGQYVNVNGDGDEIAAVRDADDPLASLWIFRLDGTKIVDVLGERHSPSPNVVFFADIRGNQDDEVVVLRQVRPELGPRPRLIVRDGNNNDAVTMTEEALDGDNEYKGGDGGDIDGDGRDEVLVIRNNRIRIYYEPESSKKYELIERFSNGETIKVGNLDAKGLAARSLLVASRTEVSAVMPPGQATSGPTIISLDDSTKGAALPFSVRVEGATGWASVMQTANSLPADLQVTFRTEGIQPGEYSGQIVVTAQGENVDNNPLVIELSLIVENVISASPASLDFVYYPCAEPYQVIPRNPQTVSLSASNALSYTAHIEGNPTWITVAPSSGVLPDEVEVTVDPTQRSADIITIDLLVTVDLPGQPGIVNSIPISFACPKNRSYVPVVAK